jgi:sugar phosphate isomerase/epimerase
MARVRRGVTTLTTDYRTAIPSAGKAGVDFVELGMEGPHRRERVRAEASEIRALADVYGVGLVVHLPYRLDLASPYEHVRRGAHEECEAALEAATTVDARRAVLHARTDALRHTADSAALGDRFVESVLDLDSYADHCGIDLAVENVAGDVFSLPEGFLPVFERTEVSVRLDVVRAAAAGLTTPETTGWRRRTTGSLGTPRGLARDGVGVRRQGDRCRKRKPKRKRKRRRKRARTPV